MKRRLGRAGRGIALLLGGTAACAALWAQAPAWLADLPAWWAPGQAHPLGLFSLADNPSGQLAIYQPAGATATQGHPFFTPPGRNGRACVTCHQPADGMSLSVATIQQRWKVSQGSDPLFAAIDGADCPTLPRDQAASHSLLLKRGLFRIARPWPPRGDDGQAIEPEFDIEVVRDPTGCNTDKIWGLHSPRPYVSVYRRPRPATNLKYVTAIGYDFEPKTGLPMLLDPETKKPTSGNLLADGRALTLKAQVLDAMRWHLEVNGPPDPAQVQQIIDFESGLYSAQISDKRGGRLDADGARGGPVMLAEAQAGALQSTASNPSWSQEFAAWKTPPAELSAEQQQFRESVLRGVEVFSRRTFLIRDSAGLNNIPLGNPVRDACSLCHNMLRSGLDVAPGRIDLGTTNFPHADPSPELPLFRLTCKPGAQPHPYLGRVVLTQDPGYALTTGRCRDIGKITMQQFRGLAARAPYFSNGSAQSILDIVRFYDRRYNIGYSAKEIEDLVNLMSVL